MRCVVLFCLLAFVASAGAQDHEHGVLLGRVFSVYDTSAVGDVEFSLRDGRTVWEGDVRADGTIVIGRIPEGDYVFNVREPFGRWVEAPVTIARGYPARVDMYIRANPPDHDLLFGEAEAERDLAAGVVNYIEFSMIDMTHFYVPSECYDVVRTLYDVRMDSLRHAHGFSYRDVTEEYFGEDEVLVRSSVRQYNQRVHRYLVARNGEEWPDQFESASRAIKQRAVRDGCPAE